MQIDRRRLLIGATALTPALIIPAASKLVLAQSAEPALDLGSLDSCTIETCTSDQLSDVTDGGWSPSQIATTALGIVGGFIFGAATGGITMAVGLAWVGARITALSWGWYTGAAIVGGAAGAGISANRLEEGANAARERLEQRYSWGETSLGSSVMTAYASTPKFFGAHPLTVSDWKNVARDSGYGDDWRRFAGKLFHKLGPVHSNWNTIASKIRPIYGEINVADELDYQRDNNWHIHRRCCWFERQWTNMSDDERRIYRTGAFKDSGLIVRGAAMSGRRLVLDCYVDTSAISASRAKTLLDRFGCHAQRDQTRKLVERWAA